MECPFDKLIPFELLESMVDKEVIVGQYHIYSKTFIQCYRVIITKVERYARPNVPDRPDPVGYGLNVTWEVGGRNTNYNSFWATKWSPEESYPGNTGILWCGDPIDIKTLTNKDRAKCYKCGCKTLKRRDFSDMSIREFCPRCKV